MQTKHNTCPLSGPRWWLVRVGVHQGSLAIDGWKSNFNRSCEINDSPGITSQREAEQWFWFQIRYLSHTIFFKSVLFIVWLRINWLYLTFYPCKISFPIEWILEIGTINWIWTFGTFDRNRNIHLTINDHLTRVCYCCVIAGLRSNPPLKTSQLAYCERWCRAELWLASESQLWAPIGPEDLSSELQSYHHPFLSRLTSPVLCNVMVPNAGQPTGGHTIITKDVVLHL